MAIGDPTGDDLCVGTTDGDTLPDFGSDWEERTITFVSGVVLTSGVKYAIVVKAAAGDVYWTSKNNVYAGGVSKYSDDSGETWNDDGTLDTWFKVCYIGTEKDTNTFDEETGFGYEITDTDWNAQSFTASETYTATKVILKLCKFPFTTPGNITVSIKATEGLPSKATTPAPANTATDVTLDQATLTWVDGGGATSYDVYYGESAAVVAAADNTDETGIYLGNQAGLSLTVTGITSGSPYSYLVARYWRIDSVNASGTTTGDAWSFTTLRFKPPEVTYFNSITGQYYQLLIDANGDYGDHPVDGGVEGTDFEYLAATYSPNFMRTMRKLVGAANDKIWVKDL